MVFTKKYKNPNKLIKLWIRIEVNQPNLVILDTVWGAYRELARSTAARIAAVSLVQGWRPICHPAYRPTLSFSLFLPK